MKNYYDILQVNRHSDDEIIKKVFKHHIKKNHPDLFSGVEKELAEKRVQEFNEAYEILSDKEKRTAYNIDFDLEQENKLSNTETLKKLEDDNTYLKDQLQQKEYILKTIYSDLNIDTNNLEVNNFDENGFVSNNLNGTSKEYANSTANYVSYTIETFKNTILKLIFSTILILRRNIFIISIFKNKYQ